MAGVWVDGVQIFIVQETLPDGRTTGYCATCGDPYTRGWEASHPRCRWQWLDGGVFHDIRSGACMCGAWHGKQKQVPARTTCGLQILLPIHGARVACIEAHPCPVHAYANEPGCECRWNRKVHGDNCPEHGTRNAALPVVLPVAPAPDAVSGGDAVRAALADVEAIAKNLSFPARDGLNRALHHIKTRLAILEGLAATECDKEHVDD